MLRVPLLFRGVAVLLLAAATVAGQTPEPPAELLTLDSGVSSAPDFLRQFSSDSRHPLLSLMVDGELTAFETAAPPQASKINHPPKESAAAPKTAADEECVLEGGLFEGGSLGNACPTVCNCFPYACPPPQQCCCRKCQRQRNRCQPRCGHHCCGNGSGYGNPYLNWPTCPAWCYYGAPLEPGSYGCCGRGCCQKRCGKHQNCGNPYGCCGMGYGGYMDCGFCGGCMPPPQQNCCHKCQRKQRCCSGYGYGCGYGSVMAAGCCGYMDPCYGCGYGGYGCGGKQRCRRQRCCHQQPPPCPYFCCPMMTPCMGMGGGSFGMGMGGGSFGADWAFEGDGGQDALVLDSGN